MTFRCTECQLDYRGTGPVCEQCAANVVAPINFRFEVRCPTDEAYRKMLESMTQMMIRGFSVGFDTRNVREAPPDNIAVEPETFVRVLR